jgi:MSHA biogenesis protein MshQ
MFLLFVWHGDDADTVPATPAGFTAPADNSWSGGTGAWGLDTGLRRVTVFTRISDGTETGTITVNCPGSGTGRHVSALMAQASKTTGDLAVECTGGSDNTSGTDYSVTGASVLGFTTGDLVYCGNVATPDTATISTQSVAATGATFGSPAYGGIATGANTNDNDLRLQCGRGGVTGGPATDVLTLTTTWAAAVTGGTVIVRVYEATAVETFPRPALIVPSATTQHAATW